MNHRTDRDRLKALLRRAPARPSWRARLADWCWRVVWAYGRPVFRPLGLWRCDECDLPLPRRLVDHDCPTDDQPWPSGWEPTDY